MPAGQRTNTRNMHKQRDAFFLEGQRLDADPVTRDQSLCWLCHTRIDYTVPAGTSDDSHHLDHFHTVKARPDLQEDWDNFRHAHQLCNLQRGERTPSPGLGEQVPDWWGPTTEREHDHG